MISQAQPSRQIPQARSARMIVPLFAAVMTLAPQMAWGGIDDGEETHVVVKAGTVITVSGEEYSPGMVVITDGKIALVGSDLEYPPEAKVINAGRQVVMPGMVLPRTRFGLGSYMRKGVNGDQKVSSEIYLDLLDFNDMLEAGYTTACYIPSGIGINGLAAAYRTAGPESRRLITDSAYLDAALRWNASGKGKAVLQGGLKKAKSEIEKVEKARAEWDEKKKKEEEEKKKKEAEPEEKKPDEKEKPKGGQYSAADGDEDKDKPEQPKPEGEGEKKEAVFEPPPIDPKHQPLVDLIQEKKGALLVAQLARASDLLHFINVLESSEDFEEIAHSFYLWTWRSSNDFHYVIEQLGERKARVMVRPQINMIPYTTNRFNLMAELAKAGCELSSMPANDSRWSYMNVRPQLAQVVQAGLSREAALKSVTLGAANSIGLGDRLGSLEKDKDADLIFLDGDPLDPHSKVQKVMILGEVVWEADDNDK